MGFEMRLTVDPCPEDHTLEAQMVAYLMVVNLPEWHWAVLTREQLIGRAEEAEVRLPSRFTSVSRRHAAVWADDAGRFWIRDLGSQMGTAVNGVLLALGREAQIVIGDRLLLGGLELELVESAGSMPSAPVEEEAPEMLDAEETSSSSSTPRRRYADASTRMLADLSPAELDIVLWMSRGFTRLASIGRKLHRSPNTVRTQLGSIFRKTKTHSRDELVGRLRRASNGADDDSTIRPREP